MTTDYTDEFQGSREGSVLSLDSSADYITVGYEYLEVFFVGALTDNFVQAFDHGC